MSQMIHSGFSVYNFPKEFKKGESGLFLTLVLTLWGDGYIDRHVWR